MCPAGRRGAYRTEERAELPKELQKELVEKAAARYGNCQELAKALDLPKSSVHYYRSGRLTLPLSVMEQMLKIAGDEKLEERVREAAVKKDRTWANAYAAGINRDMCRERVRLPTMEELESDHELRRKAANIVSYVLAEGSIWIRDDKCGEAIANITFSDEETDLYDHFRRLCVDVFEYDIGPPQMPGNGAKAIRGFIYSRFIAEWLLEAGIPAGDKSAARTTLPNWVMESCDEQTWIAAIQPFCDGEGSVATKGDTAVGFTIVQARHTDLDLATFPLPPTSRDSVRKVHKGFIRQTSVFGIPTLDYCQGLFRSEVLDDVNTIMRRLGIGTRISLVSMYLKDNGFWSCYWRIFIPRQHIAMLLSSGALTQKKKVARALSI